MRGSDLPAGSQMHYDIAAIATLSLIVPPVSICPLDIRVLTVTILLMLTRNVAIIPTKPQGLLLSTTSARS
ncbi:hypothetical protein CSHISOI_10711 [Colletotrichum shisoi]|uniref:Uncharacterized protein n=1 Tax=Colletotrichum shisoi TaxID=2078593 RepID=A0A5Q4BDA1_9PEZI|nr:hypothetical protein CSHISOI_10711 [Colletotrichum shisoi]